MEPSTKARLGMIALLMAHPRRRFFHLKFTVIGPINEYDCLQSQTIVLTVPSSGGIERQ